MIFTPYGPLHSVHVPKSEPTDASNPNAKPLARGFAFVWFLSKKDAEKAIQGVNGTKVVGGIASRPQGKKKKGKKSAEKETEGEVVDESPEVEGRVVAVDWALSKERWEKTIDEAADEGSSSGEEGEKEDTESGASDEDGEEDDEDEDAEAEQTLGVNDEESGSDNSGSENSDSEEDDDESMAEPATSSKPPPPEEGTTLFIRNVPFEATDEDLGTL